MRAIAEFVKTTLIGGLLIVLPVYIAVLLILKSVQGLVTAMKPITAAIPGSGEFEAILAILMLAAICFVAGLIVRTRVGLRAKNFIERRVLQKAPRLHADAAPYRTCHGSGRRPGFRTLSRGD